MSGHVSSLESGKLTGHSLQRTEALEDQELVGRYLDGDVVAFDELMTRHQRSVFRLCLRFAKNHDDALDLTQEVFIKAFERLDGFRGDARFRTWIYRVAVNHCLNWVKKNSREFVEVTENTGSVRPSVDGALLRGERRAIVSNLIEMLPPKQKVIFRLRMQENLSYEEIAAIVGRSVSTVKSSVFFAMTKLRKLAANSNVHPNGRASR
jgi:RNA polymerase sigma-70 factor (ECF subfamily)